MYDYHSGRLKNCIPPKIVGILGQLFAVQKHYISYADLLKIRYSSFPCLIIVGTEDRLVREGNSYMLQRVCLFSIYTVLLLMFDIIGTRLSTCEA